MKIWAISDLHLYFSVPEKKMTVFGDHWYNHPYKIANDWEKKVSDRDIVLLSGDFCWAKTLEEATKDLNWLANLPGRKVFLKGNHDRWWKSLTKVRQVAPRNFFFLHRNHINLNGVEIFGARLWDTSEYNCEELVHWVQNDYSHTYLEPSEMDDEKYKQELEDLKASIESLKTPAGNGPTKLRICMTHYPPCDAQCNPSRAKTLIESAGAQHVVFGHLHSIKKELAPNTDSAPFLNKTNAIKYHLCSCDYLNFELQLIAQI